MKSILIGVSILMALAADAYAHCEIPCGIYDDKMRIAMIEEHITTIEKSMKQIAEMGDAQDHNPNQLVRWVMNKERHADELQGIVAQYFMTQRIKADSRGYEQKLKLLHQMLVRSMKCKQTNELDHVTKLRNLVDSFSVLYFVEQK